MQERIAESMGKYFAMGFMLTMLAPVSLIAACAVATALYLKAKG